MIDPLFQPFRIPTLIATLSFLARLIFQYLALIFKVALILALALMAVEGAFPTPDSAFNSVLEFRSFYPPFESVTVPGQNSQVIHACLLVIAGALGIAACAMMAGGLLLGTASFVRAAAFLPLRLLDWVRQLRRAEAALRAEGRGARMRAAALPANAAQTDDTATPARDRSGELVVSLQDWWSAVRDRIEAGRTAVVQKLSQPPKPAPRQDPPVPRPGAQKQSAWQEIRDAFRGPQPPELKP